MKIVGCYETLFEAQVARTKLENEGIVAVVQNENTSGMIPVSGGIASLRPYVTVADSDAARAAEILDVPEVRGDVCPECGSGEVEFKLFWRGKPFSRGAYHWLIFVVLALLGHSGNIRRRYYCRNCGSSW